MAQLRDRRRGRSSLPIRLLSVLGLGTLGILGVMLSGTPQAQPQPPPPPQAPTLLSVRMSVDPDQIFLRGAEAEPERATVTLELETAERPRRLNADILLVIDRSASFPLEEAVDAAERILDRLGPNDRVGLVSFATEARLDVRLVPATRSQAIHRALRTLVPEGKTALGEGMAVATDELTIAGRTDVELLEILLTDGRTNYGRDPLEEARKAAERGIVIYPVGVGRSVNRALLEEIARITGGEFFPAFHDAIVDQILQVQLSPDEPLVRDLEIVQTLAEGLRYEQALETPPTRVTTNPDGTTTLLWQLPGLRPNERWRTRFLVSGDEEGLLPLAEDPSRIRFFDLRGREVERDLPALFLQVRPRPRPVTVDFRFHPPSPTRFDEVCFTDQSTVEAGGRIVSWLWNFGDGTTSTEPNPCHRYRADGEYEVTLTVTSDEGVKKSVTKRITVFTPPQTVKAAFRFEPEMPTIFDEVRFFDETTLNRGEIVSWVWDFGDGTRAFEPNPTHQYAADGDYTVTLTVVSDEGVEATTRRTLTVFTPKLSVRREIDTYIPVDQTIPGQTFRVTVQIRANTRIHGAGLDENVPPDWVVRPVDNSTAELRLEDLQWLFTEVLEPGTVKTIVYEVTVPDDETPGTYRIDGTLSSASPRVNLPVDGDTQIEVLSGFPIRVVIAHWDASNRQLDLKGFPNHTIDLNQILQAISWWREGIEVPFTEDAAGNKQKIDFRTMQELVAYWLTDTSVFDPLPEE